MRFIETPVFTKRVKDLLSDEDYRTLQVALLLRPEQGRSSRAAVDSARFVGLLRLWANGEPFE
jgi:hypothetical protein